MRTMSIRHCSKATKYFASLFILCVSFTSTNNALATFIDFDELDPVYDEVYPCWCDNPLTDQYLSKGLLISGAWVVGLKPFNSMLTSDGATLSFVGELPTFFSMNVTSAHDDAIIINIYGNSGLIATKHTSGWLAPDVEYVPAIPNELFSFSSTEGIHHVDIDGNYNLRTGAYIDNLTYTYSSVPEPSSLLLMLLGLMGIRLHRLRAAQ
ncbi:MAG: PEP-CTERM sorting domain-containing protein [Gammaproteobacteria bacterium]|nr:MAG: PEP-CTERM sorting domain-containing protein [Gammaproteobacteria bacterium]